MNAPIDTIYDAMSKVKHKGVTVNDLVGGGDPKQVGISTLEVLLSLNAIRAESVVFDIGCGCGRTAIEQAKLLTKGKYFGFDIVPALVNFCRNAIEPVMKNTTFYLSAAINPLYQDFIDPGTGYAEFDSLDLRPDLITAFSVFTHFDLDTAMSYFKRMRDMLQPDGTICVSMFLLNASSIGRINAGRSNLVFDIKEQGVIYGDPNSPLTRVGWTEDFLHLRLAEVGLEVHRVIYGNWSGTYATPY
jgi:SAM-dependent methyltransferase